MLIAHFIHVFFLSCNENSNPSETHKSRNTKYNSFPIKKSIQNFLRLLFVSSVSLPRKPSVHKHNRFISYNLPRYINSIPLCTPVTLFGKKNLLRKIYNVQ